MYARELISFIKKSGIYLVILAGASGGMFSMFAEKKMQSYTANVLIEYKNAEEGYAPDGTEIDVSEITSSKVVSDACKELGIADNVDSVRNSIWVNAVVDEEEEAMYLAKLERAEEYEIISTRYMLGFSSDVSYGKEYPRKVLNAVLQSYFNYFGENHSSQEAGVNNIGDIYLKSYDYIEMMDLVDSSLDSVLSTLNSKISSNDTFRSTKTGYSFSDLYSEFSYLRNIESPKITADILKGKVTKDKEVLLTKYQKRNADLDIEMGTSEVEVEKIIEIIDSYVGMMSSSDNTDIDKDYILQEVYEDDRYNGVSDKTTEYDQLLMNYVASKTGYEYNKIDYAYNEYILSVFENALESSTEEQEEIYDRVVTLVEKINDLYELLRETNNEYNEYLGASNVAVLSNVTVSEKISVKKYTVLFTFAVFMMEIVAVVVLHRLWYILNGKVSENE